MRILLCCVAALALGLPAASAQNSFKPVRPEPLDDKVALECIPVKETAIDRNDPVYKIVVRLSLGRDGKPDDLVVVHHARSGAQYNRADQYENSALTQTPGKTDFSWTGTWTKRPSMSMRGNLWRSDDNRWNYSEQQLEYGRVRYAMLSICHPIGRD